jgi:hypothetical protein
MAPTIGDNQVLKTMNDNLENHINRVKSGDCSRKIGKSQVLLPNL